MICWIVRTVCEAVVEKRVVSDLVAFRALRSAMNLLSVVEGTARMSRKRERLGVGRAGSYMLDDAGVMVHRDPKAKKRAICSTIKQYSALGMPLIPRSYNHA